MAIAILVTPSDVERYVETVRSNADSDRTALGFLPETAYSEAAAAGHLFVAVSEPERMYAGHVLFGGLFPHGRIFQLYVHPTQREKGVATQLVDSLVADLERQSYLSITAKVADDLGANAAWDRLGFATVLTKPGGGARRRTINLRVRDLDTPNLLALTGNATWPTRSTDFRLIDRFAKLAPLYLIDLNIFFDVVKQRRHAGEAGSIMTAAFQNTVRLAVTEEFIAELERTTITPDPVLELAKKLPRLPQTSARQIQALADSLGLAVFPERAAAFTLTVQDQSDIRHLAEAIHQGAKGFITREKAILRAKPIIKTAHDLDVISAAEFANTMNVSPGPRSIRGANCTTANLEILDLKPAQFSAARAFLLKMGISPELVDDALAPAQLGSAKEWTLIKADGQAVAFGALHLNPGPAAMANAIVVADETSLAAEIALDHIIAHHTRQAAGAGPVRIRIREVSGHANVRRVAISHGYRQLQDQTATLDKLAFGRVITPGNWSNAVQELKALADVTLPATLPDFEEPRQEIRVKSPSGRDLAIPLVELENLLSPAIVLLPNRSGAIIPIRRAYVEDLFGGGNQYSLLAPPEAQLRRERAYFSTPRNAGLLKEGTPVVFYESGRGGGRLAAVAIARVSGSEVQIKTGIEKHDLNRGVLTPRLLNATSTSDRVSVTTFDNVLLLSRPVALARLREIGCADGSNLVTARALSFKHLLTIVKEGEPRA